MRGFLKQGFEAKRILVVDTSSEPEFAHDLQKKLQGLCQLILIENRGYGNAVNIGLDYWASSTTIAPVFILVATHEVVPRPRAIASLRNALLSDAAAAAAGPTLVAGREPELIWSKGGKLSRVLRIPQHYGHRQSRDEPPEVSTPMSRVWLDGAVILYRFAALNGHRFDESYFMYLEETDLHLRLADSGLIILWVPEAVAWQSSEGMPNFRLARNLRLLFRRRGRRLFGLIAVTAVVSKRALGVIVRGQGAHPLNELAKGLTAHLPKPLGVVKRTNIFVINPLGSAFAHYTHELLDLLAGDFVDLSVANLVEPSFSERGRAHWLAGYIVALRKARGKGVKDRKLIITWPLLGYLDLVIIAVVYGRGASLLMHDPKPLVRAVGYGMVSRLIARPFSRLVTLVVHSNVAGAVVEKQRMNSRMIKLPHPILAPAFEGPNFLKSRKPMIRVLGQFKPDRDLDALREIATRLEGKMSLEIWGRGWPNVNGWLVTEGFVSEPQLLSLTKTADAVLIPYTRFFQSGIAVRCLEVGTPVIGTRDGSLAELLGSGSRLLVNAEEAQSPEGWIASIQWAVSQGQVEIQDIARSVRKRAVSSWGAWADGRDSAIPQQSIPDAI